MTRKIDKCPACGSDVLTVSGDEGTGYYEPCGSDLDTSRLSEIETVIKQYYLSLDRREHGGVAQDIAMNKIQQILGLQWKQGQMLNLVNDKPGMAMIYDS